MPGSKEVTYTEPPSGFTEMPTPYGFLVAHLGTASVLLASATEYLADAQDGWDWCVQDVLA